MSTLSLDAHYCSSFYSQHNGRVHSRIRPPGLRHPWRSALKEQECLSPSSSSKQSTHNRRHDGISRPQRPAGPRRPSPPPPPLRPSRPSPDLPHHIRPRPSRHLPAQVPQRRGRPANSPLRHPRPGAHPPLRPADGIIHKRAQARDRISVPPHPAIRQRHRTPLSSPH